MNPRLRLRARLRYVTEPVDGEPAGGGAAAAAKADPPKADDAKATATTDDDKPLGPAGEKALHAERDARKELERTVAQMQQAQKDQTAALAAALGIKPDAKDEGAQTLTTLQAQVEQMRLETTVLRLAAQHKIVDADDIELLKSAKDEDAMGKLAVRLAAKADDSDDTKGGKKPTVKPDKSQGGGAADKGTSVAAGRDLWAERHPSKTT